MQLATQALRRLEAASFSNVDVDWEQVLRLNYAVLLNSGLNYVDVGGNLGAHATCFLNDMQASKLTIFEPIPDLFRHLNDRFSHDERVKIHQLALSDTNTDAVFYVKENAWAESGLQKKEVYSDGQTENLQPIPVSIAKLDDVDLGFDPHFIKIDIEGAEISMLRGASTTIARSRPLISVEYGSIGYEAFGHTAESLPNWCKENGYQIFDLMGNGFEEGEFLNCVNRYYWDFLLIPAERVADLSDRLAIVQRVTNPLPLSKWRETNWDIINRM